MKMMCDFSYNKKNLNDFVPTQIRAKAEENVYKYFSPYFTNFQLKVCTFVTSEIFFEICKYYKQKYTPYSINKLPTAQRNFFAFMRVQSKFKLRCETHFLEKFQE